MESSRRDFLATAATAAGAAATGNLAHAQDQGHEHSHQAVPSDLTLRVKSLESLLVEKGLVDRAALDALVDTYEHKVRPAQRRAGGGEGLGRSRIQAAPVGGRRQAAIAELGFASAAGRAHGGGRKHTVHCTTWSSARCAPVIRGPCSACRRCGTSPRPIVRAR